MRKWTVSLGLVIWSASWAHAQPAKSDPKSDPPAKPKEGTLEDLLSKALKHNPDIRVAEVKLVEAQAELHRVRQQVVQKVSTLRKQIAAQETVVADTASRRARMRQLAGQKTVSEEMVATAELSWQKAKAELGVLEAQMRYLTGQTDAGKIDWQPDVRALQTLAMYHQERHWDLKPRIQETLADKIRSVMAKPIEGGFTDVSPREIVSWLADHAKDINVQLSAKVPGDAKASIKFKSPVPLGAAFQWLEDEFGWGCVIRDYGIVIADRDRLPPGALLLQDFLKSRGEKEKK